MTFRIRYSQADRTAPVEALVALVEANSPAEAIVKFRCTRSGHSGQAGKQEEVLGVSVADVHDRC